VARRIAAPLAALGGTLPIVAAAKVTHPGAGLGATPARHSWHTVRKLSRSPLSDLLATEPE